jgi:methyl-accepting chemotaxis protein
VDWIAPVAAAAAALGVGAREGVNYFKKTPEVGESLNKIVETLAHFTELAKGVTSEEVTHSIESIKQMADTLNKEDPENPGQKLVWFPPYMRRVIQQLASNIDAQTRVLKQIVDVVKVLESELRDISYELKRRGP